MQPGNLTDKAVFINEFGILLGYSLMTGQQFIEMDIGLSPMTGWKHSGDIGIENFIFVIAGNLFAIIIKQRNIKFFIDG